MSGVSILDSSSALLRVTHRHVVLYALLPPPLPTTSSLACLSGEEGTCSFPFLVDAPASFWLDPCSYGDSTASDDTKDAVMLITPSNTSREITVQTSGADTDLRAYSFCPDDPGGPTEVSCAVLSSSTTRMFLPWESNPSHGCVAHTHYALVPSCILAVGRSTQHCAIAGGAPVNKSLMCTRRLPVTLAVTARSPSLPWPGPRITLYLSRTGQVTVATQPSPLM